MTTSDGATMVPAALFQQALELLGGLYDSDPCVRTTEGDCLTHDDESLDPDDECQQKRVRAFLHEHRPGWRTDPVPDRIVPVGTTRAEVMAELHGLAELDT